MDLGMNGIGLYWCIVECLYENGGYIDLDKIELLAYELRVEKNLIENLINNYELFKTNKKSFYSKSVLQRLETMNEKSKKNRENVQKRWAKTKAKTDMPSNGNGNTNVSQSNYYIKEKKINKKENNNTSNIFITTTDIYTYTEQNFGRTLSAIEYQKIESWLSLYQEEVIKHAIKIAVMNAKKTFQYVEGILNNWKGKNLNTLEQIQEEEKNYEHMKYQMERPKVDLFDYDWLNDNGD